MKIIFSAMETDHQDGIIGFSYLSDNVSYIMVVNGIQISASINKGPIISDYYKKRLMETVNVFAILIKDKEHDVIVDSINEAVTIRMNTMVPGIQVKPGNIYPKADIDIVNMVLALII